MQLAADSRVRTILTGTPMPQSALDLYSQLNVLWPDQQLTGTRAQFQARVDSSFQALIDDISPFFVRTPKSALGIPPYVVVRHEVEMGELQGEIYDLVVARFRRRLADAPQWQQKIDSLRRGRPIRLIQAASNPDLLNQEDGFFRVPPIDRPGGTLLTRLAEYRQREVPSKFETAIELLSQQSSAGRKTVVWTSFVRNIDQFANLVRRLIGDPIWVVDGRVPAAVNMDLEPVSPDDPGEELDATREQRIEHFLNNEGPAVLVANPAACGESISLHRACQTAIYLDRTYDCARYIQSIDRIHRLGLPPDAEVTIHVLEAIRHGASTADGLVQRSLDQKWDRMEALLQGAELVPVGLGIEDDPRTAEGDRQDLEALLAYLLGE
jgi:SNF2 family DNA or RNA helicase